MEKRAKLVELAGYRAAPRLRRRVPGARGRREGGAPAAARRHGVPRGRPEEGDGARWRPSASLRAESGKLLTLWRVSKISKIGKFCKVAAREDLETKASHLTRRGI